MIEIKDDIKYIGIKVEKHKIRNYIDKMDKEKVVELIEHIEYSGMRNPTVDNNPKNDIYFNFIVKIDYTDYYSLNSYPKEKAYNTRNEIQQAG